MTSNDEKSTPLEDSLKTQAEIKNLQAETSKFDAEAKRLNLENKSHIHRYSQLVQGITVLIAIAGVLVTQFQAERNRQQTEQFHQDELFSKSISQLSEGKQHAAAISTIADFAVRLPKYKNQALTLITEELEDEKDPAVLQISINALPQFGTPAIEILIEKNRRVYERLARATGRYLGVESVLQRIRIEGQPSLDNVMAVYLFKLNEIASRTSLPWQTASAPDAEFFQTPDSLAIHPRFRSAFLQPSLATLKPTDEMDAEKELQLSIYDLWVNTQAIVKMLRSLSSEGKLVGINLRKTILLQPNLCGTDLHGIDAELAVWMAPILRGTDLSFANLSHAEMKYADLRSANLTGADVSGSNFATKNKRFEERTFTDLKILQQNVTLEGANIWDMADSYLKTQKFDPTKKQELQDERRRVLAKPEANLYQHRTPGNPCDE